MAQARALSSSPGTQRHGERRFRATRLLGILLLAAAALPTASARRALQGYDTLGGAPAPAGGQGQEPCFSQLQSVATHNSYHLAPVPGILKLLTSALAQALLPSSLFLPFAWEYSHRSLTWQLDQGVTSLELDVHADPQGGRFGQAAGLRLAGVNGTLPNPELYEPGFKVFHVPDFDFNSTCFKFTECLAEVQAWSEAHPDHLPLTIYLEAKQSDEVGAALGSTAVTLIEGQLAGSKAPGPDKLTSSLPMNASLFGKLEAEVLSVFNASSIITPDSVRPDPSLNLTDVLLVPPNGSECPWPALSDMRGKVLFVLIMGDDDLVAEYDSLHPNSNGALFFQVADTNHGGPQAVFYNSGLTLGAAELKAANVTPGTIPPNMTAWIDEWVQESEGKLEEGYIVRARVDQDTVEARNNFTARLDALAATGSQLLVTDYPFVADSAFFPSNYSVAIPGGEPTRCVNGASGWSADGVLCP